MAKKNNTKRKLVGLVSEESGIRLYYTKKNTMNTPDKLMENINAFIDSLKNQKPASIKGQFVKSVYISTTMGPSILVENIYN